MNHYHELSAFNEVITVWSSYEPVFDSICPTLCSKDEVVEWIFVILISFDTYMAFNDVVFPPPKLFTAVVKCDEPVSNVRVENLSDPPLKPKPFTSVISPEPGSMIC